MFLYCTEYCIYQPGYYKMNSFTDITIKQKKKLILSKTDTA